jgi:hypothetical protein
MKPTTATRRSAPRATPDDLRYCLIELEVGHAFDDTRVDRLYWRFGSISGGWFANEEGKEASSVVAMLRKLQKDFTIGANVLDGKKSGLKSTTQIFSTRLTTEALALNPIVLDPEGLLDRLVKDLTTVAHACQIAQGWLSGPADRKGKDPLMYYDDFTQLLVEIAEAGGVAPTLGNDDVNDTPCGWLFDAAMALEPFLYPELRSPSVKACGQRLRRSLKRIAPKPPVAK